MFRSHGLPKDRLILRYISLTFKQDDVFEYEDDDLSASGSDFVSLSTKFSLSDACCTGTVVELKKLCCN